MSNEVVATWLESRRYAAIDGLRLRPLEHPKLPHSPVVVRRGQADAIILVADDGSKWILKKFHQGRCPERSYLRSISTLLPRHDGLQSGTNRRVLSGDELRAEDGAYDLAEFRDWLDGAILMPKIWGVDWASVADEIRDGSLLLDRSERLTLCHKLANLVRILEASGCAHRDIPSGNTFIVTSSMDVALIDFDSTYHFSLTMPASTTSGTEGYMPPFAWYQGAPNAAATWCAQADRFQLTLICVEFLVLGQGTPLGAEGGIFDQQHLRDRSGETLESARNQLQREIPMASVLFDSAINSQTCSGCPAPEDWIQLCIEAEGNVLMAPCLDELQKPDFGSIGHLLRNRTPNSSRYPTPRLDDLRTEDGMIADPRPCSLPTDPWKGD